MTVRTAFVLAFVSACATPGATNLPDAAGDRQPDASADSGVPPDAAQFTWPSCGTGTFDRNELYYGSNVAVAADGTVYHSQFDGGESYISRYVPGQPPERTWAHVGTGATGTSALAVAPNGTLYALISGNDHTQLARVSPAVTPIGPSVQTTSGPTSLAVSADGVLVEASFTGLRRIDLATGARTSISPPLMLREVYFTDLRRARGVTYDHGLVELTLDANLTSSTYATIFPFTTLALQFTGVDQMGRPYALIHEMSKDKIVRFDTAFASRTTLYEYPTVSGVLGKFAFGRGALRCDILIPGFSGAQVTPGDAPAVP